MTTTIPKNVEEGLFSRSHNVSVRCASAMWEVRAAIADLPHKQCWARKIVDSVDADGDICVAEKWAFDKTLKTAAGSFITESEMGAYLDSKNIVCIGIDAAVRMWAAEKESALTRAIFADDEADAGYVHACEKGVVNQK